MRKSVLVVVLVLIGVLASGVWIRQRPPSISVQETRSQLDQTVWAQEVQAQNYEDTFVKLWDLLCSAPDKRVVLENFPFTTLILPGMGEAQPFDAGVMVTPLTGHLAKMSPSDWKKFLDGLALEGFELVQSEWHHEKFEQAPGRAAESLVSVVLHVMVPASERRLILKGKLAVSWAMGKNEDGYHVPDRIELKDARILERTGQPVFQVQLEEGPFSTIQPILLYDLDGDGVLEIVLAGGNTVLRKQGDRYVQTRLCADRMLAPSGAVLADFTGDGVVDYFCSVPGGFPVLFTGTGGGRFPGEGQQVTATGRAIRYACAITAGDVDLDGDLDIWMSQYKLPYVNGQMPTPYYDANDGHPSFLLLNDGTGVFTDATASAGLAAKRYRRTYSNSLVDMDDDGDLDLLVVSDFAGIDVYDNDGQGHFTDLTESTVDERANFGMSHAFGDFNLDGQSDFYVVGMSSTTARRLETLGLGREAFPEHQQMRMRMAYGNRMYVRDGDSTYKQPAFGQQVARSGWSWGSSAFDFDNDGDVDIYVGNGHLSGNSVKDYCSLFWRHDIYPDTRREAPNLAESFVESVIHQPGQRISWNGFEHNHLFVNDAGRRFANGAFLMGAAFEFDARSVVSGDIDDDGRVDMVVVKVMEADPAFNDRLSQTVYIVKNQWPQSRNWIGVKLPPSIKRSSIGAKVTVVSDMGRQVSHVVTGDSFRAQHPLQKHFGLDEVSSVDFIKVRYLDGTVRRLNAPAINQYHVVQ